MFDIPLIGNLINQKYVELSGKTKTNKNIVKIKN